MQDDSTREWLALTAQGKSPGVPVPEPPLSSHHFSSHGLRRGLPSNNTTTKARELTPITGTGVIGAANIPRPGIVTSGPRKLPQKNHSGGLRFGMRSRKARHQRIGSRPSQLGNAVHAIDNLIVEIPLLWNPAGVANSRPYLLFCKVIRRPGGRHDVFLHHNRAHVVHPEEQG